MVVTNETPLPQPLQTTRDGAFRLKWLVLEVEITINPPADALKRPMQKEYRIKSTLKSIEIGFPWRMQLPLKRSIPRARFRN